MSAALGVDSSFDRGRIERYLACRTTEVRLAALRLLLREDDDPGVVRALHDRWADATPRYYDVVGILDRVVHGPPFTRHAVDAMLGDVS